MVQRLFRPENQESSAVGPDWSAEIRNWIRSEVPTARTELLRDTLERFRDLYDASRILMVWEEDDEPWINIVSSESRDRLVWKQAAPWSFNPLVSDRLHGRSFWFDARSAGTNHDPIHAKLRQDYSITTALALCLEGDDVDGWIFILDIDPAEEQHFLLGQVATAIVEERFRRTTYDVRQGRTDTDERVKMIARDLHDGLLQSFTGVVLQLENLLPILESQPEDARRKITEIEGILMNEQRELRSYLEDLREKPKAQEVDFDMTGRLRDLAARYQDQWGVQVEYERDSLDPIIRRALGWETYRIITEAITNATRHGRAKHVNVKLATDRDRLKVTVEDDGEGFPFRGKLGGQELTERGMAPSSLTERVHGLNGEITIESADSGSRLEIQIPIGWKSA